ncbi:MAG: heavy-metal-associated domain-containing protein [Bryobacterales bacterium]|nr:heavy-metal-associated domain-containing protein [Bryobacterales bacterium]
MESKTATFNQVTFPVQGMSCGSCVWHIKAGLEGNTGVKAVEVNLAAGEVKVSYNPRTTEPGAIADAIRKSAYKPGTPPSE